VAMAQNSQLLAEGEVLEHEMPSRSQGGGERAQQNEEQPMEWAASPSAKSPSNNGIEYWQATGVLGVVRRRAEAEGRVLVGYR